ncbi:MAG: hypothetical protein F7C36_05665 [Desulfurococcales archaeon]|nr:hypothetical protein [Desulfurococcales archaeon]
MRAEIHPCNVRSVLYGAILVLAHIIVIGFFSGYVGSIVLGDLLVSIGRILVSVIGVVSISIIVFAIARGFIEVIVYGIILASALSFTGLEWIAPVTLYFLFMGILLVIGLFGRRIHEPLSDLNRFRRRKLYVSPIMVALTLALVIYEYLGVGSASFILLSSFLSAILVSPFAHDAKRALIYGVIVSNPFTAPFSIALVSHFPIRMKSCNGIRLGRIVGVFDPFNCKTVRRVRYDLCFVCSEGSAELSISTKDRYRVIIVDQGHEFLDLVSNALLGEERAIFVSIGSKGDIRTIDDLYKRIELFENNKLDKLRLTIDSSIDDTLFLTLMSVIMETSIENNILLVVDDEESVFTSIITYEYNMLRLLNKHKKLILKTPKIDEPRILRTLIDTGSGIIVGTNTSIVTLQAFFHGLGITGISDDLWRLHEFMRANKSFIIYPYCDNNIVLASN